VKLCESAEAPKDQDISLPGKTAIICLKKIGQFWQIYRYICPFAIISGDIGQ
jgi:hypothetical protein